MIERTVVANIAKWANSPGRKPLLVHGARQVGKTVAVRLFAGTCERVIELNLEISQNANLFRQGLDATQLYQAILLHGKAPPAGQGRTLLFLDEIQACPEAIKMLRYFHEKLPEVHVVAAGSLLEIVLAKAKISFPVGRVRHLVMCPLSFGEFLSAIGAVDARAAMHEIPLPEYAHGTLLDLFHRYALVGGMPEVVADYSRKEDVTELRNIYESLLRSYLDDVPKYARNETMQRVISHCIEAAPLAAGSRITFAGFGQSNYRSREVGEALRTLEKAMLLHLLYPTTATEIPIRPDKRKSPRLQFLDTGLLNYFAGLQEQHFSHQDLHSFYRGLLAEHVVGQELMFARRSALHKPSFWVRDKSQSHAEVDFVVHHDDKIVPIEVKAGKTGRLRSLHEFMDLSPHPYAVRLYAGPLKRESCATRRGAAFKLLSLPYFLASKLPDYLSWFIDD